MCPEVVCMCGEWPCQVMRERIRSAHMHVVRKTEARTSHAYLRQDFALRHVHLIPRLQGRLKQDATLQTVTVWQLITTAKATASLSWHLKSVWITHIMSDRQIVCALQIFSVLLLFQWPTVESSCIFTALSVLVCKQFLFVFHVDINLLFNSLNDDFFRDLFKADLHH